MDVKSWLTDDPKVFLLGGRRILIAKKGREQAVQIEQLNGWLREHITPLAQNLKGQDASAPSTGIELLSALMGSLTAEAQMRLAGILVGATDIQFKREKDTAGVEKFTSVASGATDVQGTALPADFLDKEYDMDWVLDGIEIAGHASATQRLLTAFFTSVG